MTRALAALALASLAPIAAADEQDRAVQRALIQRDQQSAEFSAGARRGELETLHQKQLLESTTVRQPAAYQRGRMAQERNAVLLRGETPAVAAPGQAALPLPGGPAHLVEPVPAHGLGR